MGILHVGNILWVLAVSMLTHSGIVKVFMASMHMHVVFVFLFQPQNHHLVQIHKVKNTCRGVRTVTINRFQTGPV